MSCANHKTLEELIAAFIVTDSDGCPALNEYRVTGDFDPLGCDDEISIEAIIQKLAVEDGDCIKVRTVTVSDAEAYASCDNIGISSEQLFIELIAKNGDGDYTLRVYEATPQAGCAYFITCDNINESSEEVFRKMIVVNEDGEKALRVVESTLDEECEAFITCDNLYEFGEGVIRKLFATDDDDQPALRGGVFASGGSGFVLREDGFNVLREDGSLVLRE